MRIILKIILGMFLKKNNLALYGSCNGEIDMLNYVQSRERGSPALIVTIRR